MKNVDRLLKLASFFEKKMVKVSQTEQETKETQKVDARNKAHSKIDLFSKKFVEQSLDSALNAAPPDENVLLVNFLSKVKLQNGQPFINVSLKANSPETQSWANEAINLNAYKKGVLAILQEYNVSPPFDQDFKVERKYE